MTQSHRLTRLEGRRVKRRMQGMEPDRYRRHLANLMALVGVIGYVSAILSFRHVWGAV